MTIVSVLIVFLLQAPLLSFVYYGLFSSSTLEVFSLNVINKTICKDAVSISILIAQILLTIAFVSVLFFFIYKVIFVFLKDEKSVRVYYWGFFIFTLILPVFLIYISVLLKGKGWTIAFIVIELISTALNIVLLIFTKEILPETTDIEYRKYLFAKGDNDEQ